MVGVVSGSEWLKTNRPK